MSMDRARYIMRLLEEQSLAVTAWGIIYLRPLPKNRGLMFRVSGNRFSGLIKVRYDQADIYNIIYIPSGKGEVKRQNWVSEVELVNEISKMVGQSPLVLDYLVDMYLIK